MEKDLRGLVVHEECQCVDEPLLKQSDVVDAANF